MKLGIIGTGRIAQRFMPETKYVDGIEVVSVYNPHKNSAERYAEKWGLEAFYDANVSGCKESGIKAANINADSALCCNNLTETESLQDFLKSIDAVYIATPHGTHADYIRAALTQGKHVLCEKPMTLSGKEASELYELAETNKFVLMEGIKTAYCPGYKRLMEVARSGIIGDIAYVESCFTKLEATDSRELTDTVTGGSFTELGTYVMLPVLSLFGTEATFNFQSILREDNIDIFTKCNVLYDDGKLATATCGLGVKSEGRLVVSGTKGYILVPAPWWKTSKFEVHFESAADVRYYEEQFEGDGLRYELKEFVEQVQLVKELRLGQEKNENSSDLNIGPLSACDNKDQSEQSPGLKTRSYAKDCSIRMAGLMEEFLECRGKNKQH